LRYRDQVLDHLHTLLLMYPRGRQLRKDYPGLSAAIRREFDGAAGPFSAALRLAGDIIAGLLRQLDAEERAAVLSDLLSLDLEWAKALAAERLAAPKASPPSACILAVELCGVAIFMARSLAEAEALRRSEYRRLLAAIESALGATAEPLQNRFGFPD
jgi:hypothetical protein